MPNLAFDIGANIGLKTRELLADGYSKVVAIEPLYDNLFPDNPNVVWIKSLVSNSTDPKYIYPAGTISTVEKDFMFGRFKGQTWQAPVLCPATTLALLIDDYGVPDYIKIDVEGHELNTLQGLPKPCRVPLISFEWSCEFKSNAIACVSHLEQLGYTKFAVQLGDKGVSPPSVWYNAQQIDEQMTEQARKQSDAWGQIWTSTLI